MNTDQPTATAAEQARVDAHIHLQNERIPRITPEQALIDWATFARTLASELSSAQAALTEAKAEVARITKQLFDQHYADTNRADAWRNEAETLRVELTRAEAECEQYKAKKPATQFNP